jgi:carbamate kinase
VANETLPAVQSTSTAVALFQKAHGRMTTLQRIDEQIAALVDQRRKIQDELRAVQTLINEEFDRVVRTNGDAPQNKMLTQIAEAARENSNGHRPRVEIAEAVA